MSTPSGNLYHPINKHPFPIYIGFSWPNLFFGTFWFLYKNMWGWAIISLFFSLATGGLSKLIFPFFANKLHQNHLLNSGFLSSENDENQNNDSNKKNIRKQLFLCIIFSLMILGIRFYKQNPFKEFRMEFNNFQFDWDIIFNEKEYEIKAKPKNNNKLNNI
tara:strand:- start:2960 stop:3442 length:483 start_codon:yes stop_codon:yes gene_type:complete